MATNWAIAVGINHYANLRDLKYARQDAEAMADWLENQARFERVYLFTENITTVKHTKSTPGQPTFGNLRRFLRAFFEKPLLKPGDNFWFFFSGHGVRGADGDYLMLADSDPADVKYTALSVNYVTERLRGCGADNVVMFFDACRNEGKDGLGFGTEEPQGIITYYSCAAQEKSWEIDALKQGAFTHVLLETLRTQGDNSCITVEGLEQYLSSRVPQINQRYGKETQIPHARIEPISKRKLILFGTAAPGDPTIKDLKHEAKDAELNENWELSQQLWRRVNVATQGLDEEAIAALVRIENKKQLKTKVQMSKASSKSISKATSAGIPNQPDKPTGLSSIQIRHIKQKLTELKQEYDYLNEQIQHFRQSKQLADLSPQQSFKLDKQIQNAERQREEMIKKFQQLKSQLKQG